MAHGNWKPPFACLLCALLTSCGEAETRRPTFSMVEIRPDDADFPIVQVNLLPSGVGTIVDQSASSIPVFQTHTEENFNTSWARNRLKIRYCPNDRARVLLTEEDRAFLKGDGVTVSIKPDPAACEVEDHR